MRGRLFEGHRIGNSRREGALIDDGVQAEAGIRRQDGQALSDAAEQWIPKRGIPTGIAPQIKHEAVYRVFVDGLQEGVGEGSERRAGIFDALVVLEIEQAV